MLLKERSSAVQTRLDVSILQQMSFEKEPHYARVQAHRGRTAMPLRYAWVEISQPRAISTGSAEGERLSGLGGEQAPQGR